MTLPERLAEATIGSAEAINSLCNAELIHRLDRGGHLGLSGIGTRTGQQKVVMEFIGNISRAKAEARYDT